MKLIDLYVHEVGQRLPAAAREDIEKEIRTLIDDTLEDEARAQGRAVDADMTAEVLKRLGSPEKMAARYRPERYLIGPRLFPHYVTTLRIVLAIVAVLAVTGFAVTAGLSTRSGVSFAEMLGQVVGGLLQTVFQAAAIVTLVFAVMEYFQPDIKLDEEKWDPLAMKPQADDERVSLVGSALSILFTLIVALVFLYYPQWIGISNYVDGEWLHAPVLNDVFFTRYLPFFLLLWAAEIIKQIVLMARGRWFNGIRWADVMINLFTAVLMAVMLTGPSIISLDQAAFNRLGMGAINPATARSLTDGLYISVRITLGIIMGVALIEAGKNLYRLLRNRAPVLAL